LNAKLNACNKLIQLDIGLINTQQG